MLEEEEGAVVDARQAGTEAAGEALTIVLLADGLLRLLPLHPEGRVGQHVAEAAVLVPVAGEGVAEADILGLVPLQEHVRATDRIGFGVDLLPEEVDPRAGLELLDVLLGGGEHATCAAGRVQDVNDRSGLADALLVGPEQQLDHQLDHLARGEVLTGRLVGGVRELADQLLEDVSHVVVADLPRAEVDPGEPLDHLVQQVAILETLDLDVEVVPVDDLRNLGREVSDVVLEVGIDVLVVAADGLETLPRGVEERQAGDTEQQSVLLLSRERFGTLPYRVTGPLLLHYAVESAQHRERQDDLGVLGTFVVTPEQIGHPPDEVGQVLVRVAHSAPSRVVLSIAGARAPLVSPSCARRAA